MNLNIEHSVSDIPTNILFTLTKAKIEVIIIERFIIETTIKNGRRQTGFLQQEQQQQLQQQQAQQTPHPGIDAIANTKNNITEI